MSRPRRAWTVPHRVAGLRPGAGWRTPALTLLVLLALAGPVRAEVTCSCSCAEPPPPAEAVAAHLEEPGAAIVSGVVTSTAERTVRLDPGADALVAAVEAAVGPGTPGPALPSTDTEAADAEPVVPVRHFAAAVLVATVFIGMLVLVVGPVPRRRR